MFKSNRTKFELAPIVGIALMVSVDAASQERPSKSSLEEVIVTAQKRSANIQDVPLPVTAFNAESIQQANFTDLADLNNMVPGISIGGSGALQSQVAIRGLAPPNAGIGQEEPVALYVDDVYIGRLSDNFRNATLALESIEVLRGPQGTLYGRNAVGGAIVVRTQQPTEETLTEVRMKVGNYDSHEMSAILSGPVSENIFGLIAGKFDERKKGYNKNLADGRWTGNIKDETSFRGVLKFVPSDDLEINLMADYSTYEGSGNGPARNVLDYENHPGDPDADVDPDNKDWDTFYAWPSGDEGQNDLTSERLLEGYDYLAENGLPATLMYTGIGADIERKGFGLTVNYDFDNMLLTSVTSKRFNDTESTIDSYSRRHPSVANMELNNQEQFAQEFRLTSTGDGPLEWLAGISYFEEEVEQLNIFRRVYCTDSDTGDLLGAYSGQADCVDGNEEWAALQYNTARVRSPEIDVTSIAVFGQATYSLTENLRLTAGLRWADEEKDWSLYFKNFTVASVDAVELDASDSWDAVTGRLGLQYDVNDSTMFYVSAAEGFKSGGFAATSTTEGGETVDPEESLQYEVGVKSDLLDDRLRLNAALFYNDYTDLQLRVFCPETSSCAGSTALTNASAAEIKGAEVEFSAIVTDAFSVNGYVNYLDAVFTDYVASATEDFTGNKLPRAPELQYSITGRYDTTFSNGDELYAILTYKWSDSEFFRPNNTVLDENEANEYVSGRIALARPDQGWEIAVFGNNLTNEHYRNNGFQIGSTTVAAFYNAPRTYGVELTWRGVH